jgi:HEAT repeat protein
MVKPRSLQDQLSLLEQIQDNLCSGEALAILQQTLSSKHPVAIAKAAQLISRHELRQLMPDLVANFDRFLENAATNDPNCLAKKAIADALYRLEHCEETLFLKGIRYVQMESVWGGKVDTAPGLRGICALGLVRMHYSSMILELADLLADPEAEARIAAVKAIGYTDNPQGVPLLRLKVQLGDQDPQVMSECFLNLLKLAPNSSIDLVARFLNNPDVQISEMAALALGESKLAEVLPILQDWYKRIHNSELHEICLLSISMLRTEKAIEFLLSLIQNGSDADAKQAIAALELYPQDKTLWERMRSALKIRGNSNFLDESTKLFFGLSK